MMQNLDEQPTEDAKEAARERRESIRAMPKGPRKQVAKRLHQVISHAEHLISLTDPKASSE